MADAALPSIGVVTTLQNKVGTSLTGITSLLSPKEQTSAMVQAGASAMSTSVLLGIKNDTEQNLEQSTKTANILQGQLDLQEESERKRRENEQELLKAQKAGQGTGTPVGVPGGVELNTEDKKGFDFGKIGDIATLGLGAAITTQIAKAGGMKKIGMSLGKKLVRGGLYGIVASAVAGPLVEFVDKEFQLGMKDTLKQDISNSATGAAVGASVAGLPGAIIGGTLPMIANVHKYLSGQMDANNLDDYNFAGAAIGGTTAAVYATGKLGKFMAMSKLPMVAKLGGALAATPALLAVGIGVAAGVGAMFLAKKIDEYQEEALEKLKGTVAQVDRDMGKWAAKQEEGFLEKMGFSLGTQSEIGKAQIASTEGVEQLGQGSLSEQEANDLAALGESFLNMSDDALKTILADNSKTKNVLKTVENLKTLAVGGAFGQNSKPMFEKLNAFSDRIQGVVKEMVQIDKTSVSDTANRLIDGRTPGGDTLEKFGKLDKGVQEQKKEVDTIKQEIELLTAEKEKARIREGDTSKLVGEFEDEIKSLERQLKTEQGRLKVMTKNRDKTLGGYTFAQLMELYEGNEAELRKLVEMSVQNQGKVFLNEQKTNTEMKDEKGGQVITQINKGGDTNVASGGDQHFHSGSKDVMPANRSDYQVAAGVGVST
tara:strand:- start:4076 stop:6040 length:1965 start_codon:yes stop_codon:yes gene_type:complete